MLMKIRRYLKGESGQGMTEYIIIVTLVAIACLVAVSVFGSNIRNLFVKASDSLSKGEASQAKFKTMKEADVKINKITDANK